MERIDCVVIGAGVVGLAVARKLAEGGRDVLVLEAENTIGTQTSARNSEVIHAGIYYPSTSLKAALCSPGKEALYRYCRDRGVPHKQCGKLIVASDEGQLPGLAEILKAGHANGVSDLTILDQQAVRDTSPALNAVAAIWSPSTGIVDSHQLMLSLLADIERNGGTLVLKSEVKSISPLGDALRVCVDGDIETNILARTVVNCAGLGAVEIARRTDGLPESTIPDVAYAKGSYFAYSGSVPFDCLVYPMPAPGGLGIHLTLDQAGQARFGPDVEWVDKIDYGVDLAAKDKFVKSIQTYWPDVQARRLHGSYSGIRLKTYGKSGEYHDFVVSGEQEHGISGLVNLFGIESPGLTSCLAIADYVATTLTR